MMYLHNIYIYMYVTPNIPDPCSMNWSIPADSPRFMPRMNRCGKPGDHCSCASWCNTSRLVVPAVYSRADIFNVNKYIYIYIVQSSSNWPLSRMEVAPWSWSCQLDHGHVRQPSLAQRSFSPQDRLVLLLLAPCWDLSSSPQGMENTMFYEKIVEVFFSISGLKLATNVSWPFQHFPANHG